MDKISIYRYQAYGKQGALILKNNIIVRHILPQLPADLNKKLSLSYLETPTIFSSNRLINKLLGYYKGINLSPCKQEDISRSMNMNFYKLTSFETKVLKACQKIAYGKTITYKQLAEEIGSSCWRAVGNVMAKNPLPVFIPCHRVIRSDGKIGGFSGPTGFKQKLLQLEATNG